MSDKTVPETPVQNITSMPDPANPDPVVVEVARPNVLVRAFRKIRTTPPKTALAVVGGVALVSAGAVMGRKTAPLHLEIVDNEIELPPMLVTPASETENDTHTA